MDRRISRVPALHVSELFRHGCLPSAPDDVLAAVYVPERREMTIQEASALTWLLAGPVDRPRGVAGYRDVYDYQTSSDVREVTHIAGSKRAVVELVRFLIDDAREIGRRCVGVMDISNIKMEYLLQEMGCVTLRALWESR